MSKPYYRDYLRLPQLLSCQHPLSSCHDEFLFITVHQAYELWFRQILWELQSVREAFEGPQIAEKTLARTVAHLERIKAIQQLFPLQFDILETMTPMDFLEFRDQLAPASGFQSLQFRQVENLLGIDSKGRAMSDAQFPQGGMDEGDRKRLEEVSQGPSLLALVEKWLERMPFGSGSDFDFWREYRQAVQAMLKRDEQTVQDNAAKLDKQQQRLQLKIIEDTRKTFASLFDAQKHADLVSRGKRRLSQEATLNALFILSFREEPILGAPFRLLAALMDIDENFTAWRYRHALLAHRMLGTKIGTGGSSGHQYLKAAAEQNRIYRDLFELSSFLIPQGELPAIPQELKRAMNFAYGLTGSGGQEK